MKAHTHKSLEKEISNQSLLKLLGKEEEGRLGSSNGQSR